MLLYFSKIEQIRKQGFERGIKEAREQGREEGRRQAFAVVIEHSKALGRAEMHQKWSAWNTRRQEAEAKGIPFNEPPPPNPNGSGK